MEKVRLRIWTTAGTCFDVDISVPAQAPGSPGAADTADRIRSALPRQLENGIWRSDRVFVPVQAVAQVEIIDETTPALRGGYY